MEDQSILGGDVAAEGNPNFAQGDSYLADLGRDPATEEVTFEYEGPLMPPPPECDMMISRMAGSSFVVSAPDDIRHPKMDNGAKWVPPSVNDLPDPEGSPNHLTMDSDAEWGLPWAKNLPAPATGSSKFVDKLYTNYIPSQPEIDEIKEYVSSITDTVSLYDARIAELEERLADLRSGRYALNTMANAHEALVSPLRRLPPEILQLIFVWCLPQNRNAVMHASEAPVLLGRVCSEWRRISLATPEVWASLHIVPPNVNFTNPSSSTTRFERKRDLISMWLKRSGACPLSISLVWFAGDSEEEIKLCGILLQVLVPMCDRWKVLDFQVPLKMFRPFVGLTVNDVPLLEGMSLMDNRTPLDAEAVDRWPESLIFAESATRLRNFTLTFFSGGIRLPTIPWAQLTVLYLESNIAFFFRDAREMLDTLAECSNLQSCTLKFPLSHTAALPPYEALDNPIMLPQLHTLCVDGDQHLQNTFHMSNTLTNLVVPRLRKLEILGRSGRSEEGSAAPEPLAAIRTLLRRSKCPLERLNVESMTMFPDEFIACLRLVPSLTELVVHNWSVRVVTGLSAGDDTGGNGEDIAENQILRALTILPPKEVGTQFVADNGDGSSEPAVSNHSEEAVVILEQAAEPAEKADLTFSTQLNQSSILATSSPFTGNESEDDWTLCDIPAKEKEKAKEVYSAGFQVSSPSPSLSLSSSTSQSSGSSSFCPSSSNPTSPPTPYPSTSFSTFALPICPNLQRFDFTLGDASQSLLCDFVASRWTRPPPGVARLKAVKCNFTAFEDARAKERLQQFRVEGLDAYATYQLPINDDMNPSPWTGLEGPP